jgi:hypothetical protein
MRVTQYFPLPVSRRGPRKEPFDQMRFSHHDLEVDLPDAWWLEANMDGFQPRLSCYTAALQREGDGPIFEVPIREIAPVRRNPGVGIFNDNDEVPARDRVLRILRGFRAGDGIPKRTWLVWRAISDLAVCCPRHRVSPRR